MVLVSRVDLMATLQRSPIGGRRRSVVGGVALRVGPQRADGSRRDATIGTIDLGAMPGDEPAHRRALRRCHGAGT